MTRLKIQCSSFVLATTWLAACGATSNVGAAMDAAVADSATPPAGDAANLDADMRVDSMLPPPIMHEAYVKATNAEAQDAFGASVAISADGNTLVVGAPGESSSAPGVNGAQANNEQQAAGAVYIYTRSATGWQPQAYLKSPRPFFEDYFGRSVAVSDDGNLVVVGADSVGTQQGAVYTFVRENALWRADAQVLNGVRFYDYFGSRVALAADASVLAVAAPGEASSIGGIDPPSTRYDAPNAGAVYLYARVGQQWVARGVVKAPMPDANDNFGKSLAVAANGTWVAVGAPGEASSARAIGGNAADNGRPGAGAVYIVHADGAVWRHHAYIKASNADVDDHFGSAVALSATGDTLVVGAPLEDGAPSAPDPSADNSAADTGALYVYRFLDQTWQERAYLKVPATVGAHAGAALAIAGDGMRFVVGAPLHNLPAAQNGQAWQFNAANGSWLAPLPIVPPGLARNDWFGTQVTLSRSGHHLGVASPAEDTAATGVTHDRDDHSARAAGAVNLFRLQ